MAKLNLSTTVSAILSTKGEEDIIDFCTSTNESNSSLIKQGLRLLMKERKKGNYKPPVKEEDFEEVQEKIIDEPKETPIKEKPNGKGKGKPSNNKVIIDKENIF